MLVDENKDVCGENRDHEPEVHGGQNKDHAPCLHGGRSKDHASGVHDFSDHQIQA